MNIEDKVIKSVSRGGVIGMIATILFFFFMEFVFIPEEGLTLPSWLRFTIYVVWVCIIVIFGVDKPEFRKFFATIREALSDGKITPQEFVSIVRGAWFFMLGLWSDVSQIQHVEEKKEKEEKKEANELSGNKPFPEV